MLEELLNRKFIITIEIKEEKPSKIIENCSLEELRNALPNIDKFKVDLTYNYLHKSKLLTANGFARHYNISESYLYKIIKEIKNNYKLATE